MPYHQVFLFMLNPSLLLLRSFLSCNNSHELVSVLLCLFCKAEFFVHELSLSGFFEFSKNFLLLFKFSLFFQTLISFGFFECAFGTKSINLRLFILCFFLECSKFCDFSFFFFIHAFLFLTEFIFSLCFCLVVWHYLVVFIYLFLFPLLFNRNSLFIWVFNLSHHLFGSTLLMLWHLDLLLLKHLDVFEHHLAFALSHFFFFDALLLTLFNLIDNDGWSFSLSLLSCNFSFFLGLEWLQSFDLHHDI